MTLGIVGTGLIGASIGLRARRDGARVLGFDVDPLTAAAARERGAIDEMVSRDDVYAVCDLIVIAAPPKATCAEIVALRGRPASWELLFDVASVKRPVVLAARGVANVVATHPLAGNEGSGPGAAREDLFEGRTWVYVPSGDERRDERFRRLVGSLGAEPFACDAERHDRVVATTSHLPQLTAFLIAARVRAVDDEYERFCGPAAREALRLSASPRELWEEIVRENGPHVALEGIELARGLLAACERVLAPEGDERGRPEPLTGAGAPDILPRF